MSEIADPSEALMQFLYRAPMGLLQCGIDGQVEMINPMAAQLLMPLSRDGSLDNLFDVLASEMPRLREQVAGFAQPSGQISEATRFEMPKARTRVGDPQVLSLSLLKLDPSRLMAVVADATAEAQREQQRLHRASRTDSLTRLPNREALLDHVQQAIERHRSDVEHEFAVLFLNCDRFKQINDSLGHAAGDEVLGYMASRLQSALRVRDGAGRNGASRAMAAQTMAARVGSDEFVVVLDGLRNADDVHAVARRLQDSLAQPYGVGNAQVHCGVSMGVLMGRQVHGDAAATLQDASIAMVEAKRAGGGGYEVFEPIMHERAAARAGIESELRRAIADAELFVVYQPVVRLGCLGHDGRPELAGVEALVRWRHPTRGMVSPIEFIEVAEASGLIGALGKQVLDVACRQFVAWDALHGDAAPRILAVNLSRAQLSLPGLIDEVRAALAGSGLDPARLQLEVTESHAARDEDVKARLHELKALGVTLALDDFGTGYSSLSSLQALPVDTLKIDRSFICRAHDSAHHRVLIEATIRVAKSLGMSTVGEGIETPEQARVLTELGCDKGQGYLFARPLEVGAFDEWIRAAHALAA